MTQSDPAHAEHDPKTTRCDPQVVTFGCRLNTHESEVIKSHIRSAGLENVIVFNTCGVTAEAERQARQAIRRARRNNPQARIVVTGCASEINPQTYAQMPEVDHIIKNDRKLSLDAWTGHDPLVTRHATNESFYSNFPDYHLGGFEVQTRAFVQVQNGCDHRCTFCIIPYGRGPSRSVPVGVLVDQIRTLTQNGYKEVVLTGVDLTSYGMDLPGRPRLGQMIRRLLNLVPDLQRLRLSSLDPAAFDEDLWALIASEPRFMPHLHLSIQAGADLILKRMKRRHSRSDVINLCRKARDLRPDILFGGDLIAGFPTETDSLFSETIDLIEACDLTFLHVFPYSARTGTPAAKMPQVPLPIRRERADHLRRIGSEKLLSKLKFYMNKELQVLSEKALSGHSNHFLPVRFMHDIAPGQVVMAQGIELKESHLMVRAVFS